MPATALQAQYDALVGGGQPTAPVNDPYVPTSLLTTQLATKADRADVLGFAQDTFTSLNGKLDTNGGTITGPLTIGGQTILPETVTPTALPVSSVTPDTTFIGRQYTVHASPTNRTKAFVGSSITLDAGGAGQNGPLLADYGSSVSVFKHGFPTANNVGEIDVLLLYGRQSGPTPTSEATASDIDGIQLNIGQVDDPGYAACAEMLLTRTDSTASYTQTHSIGLQMGVNDPWGKNNEQNIPRYSAVNRLTFAYGALANQGNLDRAFYATDSGSGSWNDYFMGGGGSSPNIRIKGGGASRPGEIVWGKDGSTFGAGQNSSNHLELRDKNNTVVMTFFQGGTVGMAQDFHPGSVYINGVVAVSNRNTFVFNPQTTPPSPSIGEVYFDAALNKLRCWDGTVWQNLW